jgi:hypothetical protein
MRVSGTLLLAVLTAAVCAGDPPAPASDSIADAKKDLSEIKSQAVQGDTGASLPVLDLKDVTPGPGSVQMERVLTVPADKENTLDPSKKKSGTGNWLVDAMDKKTDRSEASRAKEKDDILKGDPDLLPGAEKSGLPGERDLEPLDDKGEKAAAKEPAEAVYNPLDSFMSGWISARDHDLLLGSKRDALTGAGAEGARADLLPGLEAVQPAPGADGPLSQVDTAAFSEARQAANPYLDLVDLTPPAQAKSFSSPEFPDLFQGGLPEISSGASTISPDSKPADVSRSFVPDFAQPLDDDKYFKQMKRF